MAQRNGTGDDDPTRIGAIRPSGASPPLEPAEGPEGSGEAIAVDADPEGVDAVARALQAGEITPTEARNQLIDGVIAARLPADADPALAAELRTEIEDMLEADPTLAGLLEPPT